MTRYVIVGGAGFIGSHVVRTLLRDEPDAWVIVYDNFSSGRPWHLDDVRANRNLSVIQGDVKELGLLADTMKGAEVVYHFASNPDIAKAVTQPDIDFWEGTYLTNNVLEAMRRNNVPRLLYASGSGVYGDTGANETAEDHSPMLPVSTYGASKLACEALVCSYCAMFGMHAGAFRFANVVGPRQTHGVGFDFVKRLLNDPQELRILGDGTQSKSYIHVDDVIAALRLYQKKDLPGFSYYNVATLDAVTVTEIAQIVTGILNLRDVRFSYTGGKRGWKGDVPVLRLNSQKIRALGWSNAYTSQEAVRKSVESLYHDALAKKL